MYVGVLAGVAEVGVVVGVDRGVVRVVVGLCSFFVFLQVLL